MVLNVHSNLLRLVRDGGKCACVCVFVCVYVCGGGTHVRPITERDVTTQTINVRRATTKVTITVSTVVGYKVTKTVFKNTIVENNSQR